MPRKPAVEDRGVVLLKLKALEELIRDMERRASRTKAFARRARDLRACSDIDDAFEEIVGRFEESSARPLHRRSLYQEDLKQMREELGAPHAELKERERTNLFSLIEDLRHAAKEPSATSEGLLDRAMGFFEALASHYRTELVLLKRLRQRWITALNESAAEAHSAR